MCSILIKSISLEVIEDFNGFKRGYQELFFIDVISNNMSLMNKQSNHLPKWF